ncbi:MAG: hypothetical protein WDN69_17530 [Aliidongia sp.]
MLFPHRRIGVGPKQQYEEVTCAGALLWLVGVPIPVVILLYVFHVL